MGKNRCWSGGTWGVSEDGIELPGRRTVPTRGMGLQDEVKPWDFGYKIDITI
jgi:hypothetical protein